MTGSMQNRAEADGAFWLEFAAIMQGKQYLHLTRTHTLFSGVNQRLKCSPKVGQKLCGKAILNSVSDRT